MILRFRDGTVYNATATDATGAYSIGNVFPFFSWLVAEVDFLRFTATGATVVVDGGGEVLPDNGWDFPSFGRLNPQVQTDALGSPIISLPTRATTYPGPRPPSRERISSP